MKEVTCGCSGSEGMPKAAAREYLAETWWDDEPSLPSGLAEVIERYNADPNAGANLFLGAMAIEGERARCQLCGEPIVLDDEDDPDSWVHAEDANDDAEHTAEPYRRVRPD